MNFEMKWTTFYFNWFDWVGRYWACGSSSLSFSFDNYRSINIEMKFKWIQSNWIQFNPIDLSGYSLCTSLDSFVFYGQIRASLFERVDFHQFSLFVQFFFGVAISRTYNFFFFVLSVFSLFLFSLHYFRIFFFFLQFP